MELGDGSLIERARVHRDERNTSATNEFTATGDLTGDVLWYVEGNTVKVPSLAPQAQFRRTETSFGVVTVTRQSTKETPVVLR